MTTGRIIDRNDKYAYVISLPPDPVTGKRKQRWRSGFATKAEAAAELRKALNALDDTGLTPDITVAEYLEEWLSRGVEGKRRPRTLENYQYGCSHISAALGKVKIDKLTARHIERMYNDLAARLSSSSVHSVHRTFKNALNRAVKWGYLDKSPMVRVDAPTLRTPRRNTLNAEQAKGVLEWLRERFPIAYIGTYLAVYSGMRRGEIAGLRWSDVGWERMALHVKRSRQRIRKQDIIGDPKTEKSTRSVPVSESVISLLRTWKRQQQEYAMARGSGWSDEAYVLLKPDGSQYEPVDLLYSLRKARKALDLPHVSFHDLRHTYATILLENGVPLKTVSELLGHADISITANTYAHVTETMQRAAVDALDMAFRKSSD